MRSAGRLKKRPAHIASGDECDMQPLRFWKDSQEWIAKIRVLPKPEISLYQLRKTFQHQAGEIQIFHDPFCADRVQLRKNPRHGIGADPEKP